MVDDTTSPPVSNTTPPLPEPPKRTEDRYEVLADLTLEVLIERLKARTATAAEITQARELIKQAGIKIVVSSKKKTKGDELIDNLPVFEDGEATLPNGVTLRTG